MDAKHDRSKPSNDKSNYSEISRRGFLEIGSVAAVTTAGLLLTGAASAQSPTSEVKIGRTKSLTDPGPTDKALDAANPDANVPPLTDAGGVPTFKYPPSSDCSSRRCFVAISSLSPALAANSVTSAILPYRTCKRTTSA